MFHEVLYVHYAYVDIEVKLGFIWSKMLNENYKNILHLEMSMYNFIMLQITYNIVLSFSWIHNKNIILLIKNTYLINT